ncbi:hypothetical protein OUS11_002116 [Enterococcus hirae]|nr:hypothetical protein [Enterococcus hirae]
MIPPKIIQPNSKQFQKMVKDYTDTHFNQPVTFGTFQQWLDKQGYGIGIFMVEEAAAQFVSLLHCLYVSSFTYQREKQKLQTIFVVRERKKAVGRRMDTRFSEALLAPFKKTNRFKKEK